MSICQKNTIDIELDAGCCDDFISLAVFYPNILAKWISSGDIKDEKQLSAACEFFGITRSSADIRGTLVPLLLSQTSEIVIEGALHGLNLHHDRESIMVVIALRDKTNSSRIKEVCHEAIQHYYTQKEEEE